jgi:predicted phosphoribosyltransferase
VAKIGVAVPVGSAETCREFEPEAEETIYTIAPEDFYGVGQFYEDFSPTTDAEVRELLAVDDSSRQHRRPNQSLKAVD